VQARTQALSIRTQSGRHTTSASRWHRLGPDGGALVDTPGFQEFGLSHLSGRELPALMPDLAPHAHRCRFGDCLHLQEPDCGIRAAVSCGRIDADRYAFYRQVLAECTP
jgi:ribosome biogenesis GTPase / thiamine phosphate phosphatase